MMLAKPEEQYKLNSRGNKAKRDEVSAKINLNRAMALEISKSILNGVHRKVSLREMI
jgi:hypothetical protein